MATPAHSRIGRRALKEVLIGAVRDLLPEEVVSAPKKGFVLPLAAWLRGRLRPQVEYFLSASYLRQQGVFDPGIERRLVRPHLEGARDMSWQVWTLLMFQLWSAQGRAA